MSFEYIASPYSHHERIVRQTRFEAVRDYVAQQLASRVWVYSPIVHCHELASLHKLPTDAEYWRAYNHAMMEQAASVQIYCLPGWVVSRGVQEEIAFAKRRGIGLVWVDPPATLCAEHRTLLDRFKNPLDAA